MPKEAAIRSHSLSLTLRRAALRHAERPAIVCGDVVWSYAQFDELVDRLARGLLVAGFGAGDRIALLSRNSHAFVAVRYAVARIAAVFVPINFMLTSEDVAYILDNSGASALFVDASSIEIARGAVPPSLPMFALPGEDADMPRGEDLEPWTTLISDTPLNEDLADAADLLQIIYTSGTESRSKGAMLTHAAVLAEYQSCITDCEWDAQTVALHSLPLFHCAQLDAMIGPALQVGAKNIITARPTPENLIPMLARFGVTSFFAPPTVWISLLRSPLFDAHDLSGLSKGYYGASIMPVEILQEINARLPGLRLWNLYGQTEIAPVATILFPHEHAERCGSAGRATLNVQTRVVDEAMCDVAPGEIGEIVHRSPQLLTAYWRNPEATAAAFAGGWFHSGDLAMIDQAGFITVVDRKKDMIKTGGENVSSREVEEHLYTHAGVAEVAVIGVPHPHWIEAVVAVVVPKSGASLDQDDLVRHCVGALAGFKVPKKIVVANDLPRNASGKILKRDLRISLSDAFS